MGDWQFCKSGHKYWEVGTWKLKWVFAWQLEVAKDISDYVALAGQIYTCQNSSAVLYQTDQLWKKDRKIFLNKWEADWNHIGLPAIFLKLFKSLKVYILHIRFEVLSMLHAKLCKDCATLSILPEILYTIKLGAKEDIMRQFHKGRRQGRGEDMRQA